MIKDKAYGIVPILYQNDRIQFLLIQHKAGHWGFPKGHANLGESDLDAACREFEEETGIKKYQLLGSVSFQETYNTIKNKREIEKNNTYFLAIVRSPKVTYQKKEIKDYAWLNYKDTFDRLTFDQSKQVLIAVDNYLQDNLQQVTVQKP